jgi:hypothetical protein
MPTMPSISEVEEKSPVSEASSLSEGMSGEGVSLDAPEHESVQIESAEDKIDSNVNIPSVSAKGIEVVATMSGFYGQQRLKEGSEFIVKDFKSLGEWMKCKDAAMERKRVAALKEKKAKK